MLKHISSWLYEGEITFHTLKIDFHVSQQKEIHEFDLKYVHVRLFLVKFCITLKVTFLAS